MTAGKLKVLWHWSCLGPYHFARMNALARVPGMHLTVVENKHTDDHGWIRKDQRHEFDLIALGSNAEPECARLLNVLTDIHPDVIIVPGYSHLHALGTSLAFRRSNPGTQVLLWSESTAVDRPRSWIRETFKSVLMNVFDGALVAGRPHVEYLRRLHVPANVIKIVGNCVDNEYFDREAAKVRGERDITRLPAKVFLFVGRLIPEKNVSGLLRGYERYRRFAGANSWSLVIVGHGPEEEVLRRQAADINGVHFTGLKQVDELPQYYGRAGCFVLPSLSEPWGLVVNEAMASRLPVLVSSRCGCATDLVDNGVNGFLFDPLSYKSIAEALLKVSRAEFPGNEFAEAGAKKIQEYTVEKFAARVVDHLQRLRLGAAPQRRWVGYGAELATLVWAGTIRT